MNDSNDPRNAGRDNAALDDMIVDALRRAPEPMPPDGFSQRVMAGLEPKRPSALTRLRLWLSRPRSVTFTPARLVPALAAAMVLLAVAFLLPDRSGPPTGADEQGLSPVRFVLHDAGGSARTVSVIGSFNGWEPGTSAMRYDPAAGVWVLEARLPAGDHEYMFLVDGRPVADPGARLTRDDGFGNVNAVLIVNGRHEHTL
jgi:hypothetical protein